VKKKNEKMKKEMEQRAEKQKMRRRKNAEERLRNDDLDVDALFIEEDREDDIQIGDNSDRKGFQFSFYTYNLLKLPVLAG
jgi:hypothetical protein